ncbi:MAG: phasin family protein [Pseudomonadota bacterium]
MAKNKKQKPLREKARKTGRALESSAVEVSRKIWLAGIGAYGMAYDVARSGATAVNDQSADMFDDLVKRGGELETEVLASIGDNTAVNAASRQVQKVVGTSQKLQETVRDRFDARMERMRSLLGVSRPGSTADNLARRLEQLEDEVAAVTKGTVSKADKMLKKRLARLSDEIDLYVGDVEPDDAPKKPKKVAKPKAAKKTKAKATKAEKVVEPVEVVDTVEDDLTLINGLGPAMVVKLAEEGITSFAQLAVLKKAEAVALDKKIVARGRMIRNEWVKQAKKLATA